MSKFCSDLVQIFAAAGKEVGLRDVRGFYCVCDFVDEIGGTLQCPIHSNPPCGVYITSSPFTKVQAQTRIEVDWKNEQDS